MTNTIISIALSLAIAATLGGQITSAAAREGAVRASAPGLQAAHDVRRPTALADTTVR